MMIKMLKTAAVVAALGLGASAQAAVVSVVDLFDTDQGVLTDNVADGLVKTSQVGGGVDPTILGGYREMILDSLDPGFSGLGSTMVVTGGMLSVNNTTGATSTAVVRWDGAAAGADGAAMSAIDETGLGGVGLGNVLTDSFEIGIVYSDAGFRFDVEAYTDAANWSKVSLISLAHPVPATSYIPLLAFLDCGFNNGFVVVTCGGTGVDFSNLGALQVVIDPLGQSTAIDLTLDMVRVVPEPASVALVGLALLGMGAAARRRKQG